jgi:hypothetical protein
MSLGLKHVILPDGSQIAFRAALSFLLYRALGLSQETRPEDNSRPQYDLQAETEIKRVIDEVNLLSSRPGKPSGNRSSRMVMTTSSTSVYYLFAKTIYAPKPFQQEVGISFKRGGQIPGAGSTVN